ncbi:hypothetical protein P8625_10860 [Tenacibaculum tangerinum]|uniref:Uncharacterized protein n=1 Tax=Tenacibaculum tangerinum TaxID=3038772 RepID=A0ABY8KZF3_9FLAO|nr:hypothetical protein [Tenacibaculum tangerinum]WGH74589.1 hypothetical protein P8625_10860 [Tenacibaculum tangerinum]
MKNPITTNERLFKIKRKGKGVDLSESMSIVNGKASTKNFETEIYQLTFSAQINQERKQYTLMVTANECISEEDKESLQKQLGVVIEGSGMYFEISGYTHSFSIQIDTVASVFIDTDSVQNGFILFCR